MVSWRTLFLLVIAALAASKGDQKDNMPVQPPIVLHAKAAVGAEAQRWLAISDGRIGRVT